MTIHRTLKAVYTFSSFRSFFFPETIIFLRRPEDVLVEINGRPLNCLEGTLYLPLQGKDVLSIHFSP